MLKVVIMNEVASGMHAERIYNSNIAILSQKACSLMFEFVMQSSSEYVVLALPGGRSVVPVLEKFLERRRELPSKHWSRLQFFMLDERLVDLDSEQSNFRLLSNYLNPLVESKIIAKSQLHPFVFDKKAADSGVRNYEEELERFGGYFHAVVLGVGEDAHIGALFPNHCSVTSEALKFMTLDDSPKPPPRRMTSTAQLIQKADFGIALFIGEGKREALRNYLDPSLYVPQCPVKLINEIDESYVITNIDLM